MYFKSDKWEIRGNSELEIVDIYVPKMTIENKIHNFLETSIRSKHVLLIKYEIRF